MPQIGWFEILIVVVLAVLIIGPKDFPIILKKIGSWVGSFKSYFTEVQRDITDCLLYTSPSPRDGLLSRMPSSA